MMQMERARLFVDGVGAAITADIAGRGAEGMVVTQALPFLRLDTPVTSADGRRARIGRVAIAMDGDLPRLYLVLRNEELDESAAESDEPTQRFTPGVATRAERSDTTLPYDFQTTRTTLPDAEPLRTVIVSDPAPRDSDAPRAATTRDGGAPAPPTIPWWSRLAWRLVWLWHVLTRPGSIALRG